MTGKLFFCMLLITLTACGSSSSSSEKTDTYNYDYNDIGRVPGPENQHFTPDGRHFISAGSGLYEVSRKQSAPTGYDIALVDLDECGVNGLADLDG